MQGFISGLSVWFHTSICLSLCQYHSLDYCSFVVSFEIEHSSLVLLFKIILSILGPLNVKISFTIPAKQDSRMVTGIALNI